MIHGSNGEVMAPFGSSGFYIRGKYQKVRITSLLSDEDVPLSIREALIGLEVNTIFTRDQLHDQVGEKLSSLLQVGSRMAYVAWVCDSLRQAGKVEESSFLKELAPDEFDMLELNQTSFELI